MDIACKYNSKQEINAFAFRTHAHDLGKVKAVLSSPLGSLLQVLQTQII